MGERLTDARLAEWENQTPEDVWNEVRRARRAETEQAATIKALADAGEEMLGALVLLEIDPKRAATAIAETAGRMVEALRLARRLP